MTTPDLTPPMDPHSSEATESQLAHAVAQGDAYRRALNYMANHIAGDGGKQPAGDYIVAYAIEEAEGMYSMEDGTLVWHNPGTANAHVEVAVQDGADGRFIPALDVTATLVSPSGEQFGPHRQEFVWHPMLFHYARNWELPEDGEYTLKVHIEPATFMRHDEINGKRFANPVDVEFSKVKISRGSEPVDPPA